MIAKTKKEKEEAKIWNEICEMAKVALKGISQREFGDKIFAYNPTESYSLKELKNQIKDAGLNVYVLERCGDFKKGLIREIFEKRIVLSDRS
jgi:hypothetical protein